MKLVQMYITQGSNFGKVGANKPKYIVIHDTGNTSPTADADNHQAWLNSTPNTGRSAHIFVDDHQAIQIIPFNAPAWHTGKLYVEKPQVPACNNFNSIGIEFCVNRGSDLNQTLINTAEVTRQLMREFAITIERVITHHMATGKSCPNTFISNPSLYNQFMEMVKDSMTLEDKELEQALACLHDKGIINTPAYWLDQVRKGNTKYLRELILNTYDYLEKK